MHLQHHSSLQREVIDLFQYFWTRVVALEELVPFQERKEILQNPKEPTAQCRIIMLVQGEVFRSDHALAAKEMVFVWVVLAR